MAVLLLIISACSRDEKTNLEEDHRGEKDGLFIDQSNNEAGKLRFEDKFFNLDKSDFSLSGDFANYGETRDFSVLFGTQNYTSENPIRSYKFSSDDEGQFFLEIFRNLAFWDPGRFLNEPEYRLLEKIDQNHSTYMVKGKEEEYMSLYRWGQKNRNYILVIGKDQKKIEKKFNEIFD